MVVSGRVGNADSQRNDLEKRGMWQRAALCPKVFGNMKFDLVDAREHRWAFHERHIGAALRIGDEFSDALQCAAFHKSQVNSHAGCGHTTGSI